MKTFLILLITILTIAFTARDAFSSGLDDTPNFYIGSSLGLSGSVIKDLGMSPLTYSGSNFRTNISFLRTNQNRIFEFRFDLDLGAMGNQFSSSNIVDYYGMYQSTSYLWNLPVSLPWESRLFLGGSLDLISANRFHNAYSNNAYNFDFTATLSPVLKSQSPFSLFNQDFSAGMSLRLPFVTYSIRPAFNSSVGSGFLDEYESIWEALYNSSKLRGPSQSFITQFSSSLNWHIRNNNRIKLEYRWLYYSIDGQNPIQAANHAITVTTLFAFK